MRTGNTYRHKGKNGKQESSFREHGESFSYKPGLISIIAPCYNEAENIVHFLNAITELDLQPYQIEVIVINDGSKDGSGTILERNKTNYQDLRIIHFTRNFGQQQALMAGIRAARGEALVTLDMDLQQPPELIPAMIRQYEMGYDAVYAIPEYQPDSAGWMKKSTSKLYYHLIKKLGSSTVVYKSNDFRLISHRVAAVLRKLPEHNLYLRGIISTFCPVRPHSVDQKDNPELWLGTTLSYRHQPRTGGRTKYTWLRMIRLAFDGMTATSIAPLCFGIALGLLAIFLAFCLSMWAFYVNLTGDTVAGWTSLMIVLLFFSSMQFLLIGLLGEYIGKIFLQVRGRPGYIVQSEENIQTSPGKTSIQNINKQKTGSRDIDLLKNGWREKDYHPEAMTRHPP